MNHHDFETFPTGLDPALLVGAKVYLAGSMESTPNITDPVFAINPPAEPFHNGYLIIGLYSTYARAEAALDARNAARRDLVPVEQFRAACIPEIEWVRDLAPLGEGSTQWQQIRLLTLDQRP